MTKTWGQSQGLGQILYSSIHFEDKIKYFIASCLLFASNHCFQANFSRIFTAFQREALTLLPFLDMRWNSGFTIPPYVPQCNYNVCMKWRILILILVFFGYQKQHVSDISLSGYKLADDLHAKQNFLSMFVYFAFISLEISGNMNISLPALVDALVAKILNNGWFSCEHKSWNINPNQTWSAITVYY